ncbi:MAG: hypothetical protein AB7H66_04395 [Hyphomonadaceae bacterium]
MNPCAFVVALTALIGAIASVGTAHAQCDPGDVLIQRTAEGVYCARRMYNPADFSPEVEALIQSMVAFGADPFERYRLDQALHTLRPGRDWPDPMLVRQTWNRINGHSSDPDVLRSAAAARGPDLFSSGWQRGTFFDCTVFALATASGRPYGVVAAQAGEIIRRAGWRSAAERNDPQRVFTRASGGMNGGEVVILTEQLGQVDIVRPENFVTTIQSNRPVLVSLAVSGADEHQVVLSRTFMHRGRVWYEMIDSGAETRGQRQFISDAELNGVMMENGIVYRPDENRVVPPTR